MLDYEIKTSKANVRIRRRKSEKGEPAVFLHGLGGSGHNWFPFMDRFSDQLDMTAPDLPGFGKTLPPSDQDYSPKNFAETIAEVIEMVYPSQRVHLFGSSSGGAVAVQLAARRPELVKTMTLVAPALPTLYPDLSAAPVILMAIPKFGEKLMQRYFELSVAERAHNTIVNTFANPKNTPENWHAAITRELEARDLQPHQLSSLLATLRSLLATFFDRSEQSPWNLVKSITAPSLFIYGGKDKLIHPRAAKKVPFFAPAAKVRVLEETGHVAHIEHVDWVAKEFSENLLRNPITY